MSGDVLRETPGRPGSSRAEDFAGAGLHDRDSVADPAARASDCCDSWDVFGLGGGIAASSSRPSSRALIAPDSAPYNPALAAREFGQGCRSP